jgi:effector-binding domain-containing protein
MRFRSCLIVLVLSTAFETNIGCAYHPKPHRPEPSDEAATRPSLRPTTDATSRPAIHVTAMQVQTLPAQTYFYVPARTTFQEIQQPIGQAMGELGRAAADGKVAFTGPPTFVYRGATPELNRAFDLEVGFPVAEGTKPFGPFKVRAMGPFRCATVVYTGPVSLIDKAYDQLIPAMDRAGLQPTDETRETYWKWGGPDAADNQTLVAVGVR